MAKKEEFAKNKKNVPLSILRKGAICAVLGTTALAGGLLVGCDEDEGKVPAPGGANFHYGTTIPTEANEGKVGDFYLDTTEGYIYVLKAEGWYRLYNIKGDDGNDATISVSDDGYWVINGVKSNVKAEGVDGETPEIEINADGYWVINGDATEVRAENEITINNDGYWVINGVATEVKAEGEKGDKPVVTINADGYWVIDGVPTETKAKAPVITINNDGYWVIDGVATETKAQGEKGEDGEDGVSVTGVTIDNGFDADGNHYMTMTFNYSKGEPTVETIYTGSRINVGTEMTLERAFEVAANGATIALTQDLVLTKGLEFNVEKNLTLDLNDHTISKPENAEGTAAITVTKGKLTISGNDDSVINVNKSLANESGDQYAIAVWAKGGEVVINGGNFTSEAVTSEDPNENFDLIYASGTGKITINGGSFASYTQDWTLNVRNQDKETASIVVNGGSFKNYDPSASATDENPDNDPKTNFVAEGHQVIYSQHPLYGLYYMVVPTEDVVGLLSTIPAGMPVNMILNDDITLPENGVVIGPSVAPVGEGQETPAVDLTIDLNGHTISAPSDTVGDGVFHVVAGGKLTINDSVGTGKIDGKCSNADGYHMAVWADGGEVVINGGNFTNTAVEGDDDKYDLIYSSNGGKITINGGIFEAEIPQWTLNLKDKANEDGSGNPVDSNGNPLGSIVVKGGKFKGYNPAKSETENPVANFVADGHAVVEEDGYYVVGELETLLAENETVTLASDVKGLNDCYIREDVELNLNGHKITFNSDMIFIVAQGHFNITGTGEVIANSNAYGTIQVTGRGVDDDTYSKLTVGKDVTLKNLGADTERSYTISVMGSGEGSAICYNTSVEFAGKSVGSNGAITVGGKVKTGAPVINIKSTAVIDADGHEAIFLAGNNICNIEAGAQITAKNCAIEIRSGQLNINGGTFVAEYATLETLANVSGGTVKGAAIAVSQHTTNQAISVNIAGGEFTGNHAVYELDTVEADATKSENVSVAISGGEFNGTVASVNDKLVITGGTFDANPSAYVEEGYEATNTEGVWTVAEEDTSVSIPDVTE